MDTVKDTVFNQKFYFESDYIDIQNYFKEYSESIPFFETCKNENCKASKTCEKSDCKTDEIYRNFLGITQEQLNELKERTSIDHLKCDDEIEYYKKEPVNIFDDDDDDDDGDDDDNDESNVEKSREVKEPISPLISVKNRQEMINLTKSKFSRTFYKYCNHEWTISGERPTTSKLEFDILRFPTIVACVRVYYPFLSNPGSLLKIKLLQEIHILGDQSLSQLKDKITCAMDHMVDKDMSSEWFLKDVGYNVTSKDEYPSSFIFIENTFYNDMRKENNKDLSKEIREWASEKELGNLLTAKMESTKISDLKVRIGRPYVYQHQGNCEHLIVFSDIRLLDSVDPQRYSCFPRVHCTGRTNGKRCMMCTEHYARWLVIGNERLTHEKALLCSKCFVSYNYVDGRKIGNFQAFKYTDPVAIL